MAVGELERAFDFAFDCRVVTMQRRGGNYSAAVQKKLRPDVKPRSKQLQQRRW